MNIFRFSDDPEECAKFHCDRHIVKMPTELAQILSTAKRYFGNDDDRLYKSTHINHPSSKWVREGKDNYLWTLELLIELLSEFDYRYNPNKHQKAKWLLEVLSEPPIDIPDGSTAIRLAMPDKYKTENAVVSYREYFKGDKRHLASWKNREAPYWYE